VIDPEDCSKELRATIEQLRSILDHAFEFIGVVDVSGRVLEVNAAALQFAGVTRDQVIGQPFADTAWWRWSTDQQARLAAGIKQAARNQFVRFEAEHRAADGTVEPIDFSFTPVRDNRGQITHLVAEGRRIGDRRRLEEELRSHARELEVAKEAAERATRSKSAFLAAASHDLRQPLQTIALVHAILARTVKGETVAPLLQRLVEAVRAMDQLLAALLDINRLESGAIAPRNQVFKLEQTLATLRSNFAMVAQEKGLRLVVPACAESVRTDAQLLEVILRNLVSNAIKYSAKGTVSVTITQHTDTLRLSVIDTGIGIATDQLERIFEDFYQIDNPARDKRRGVGLGLSIVRRISELLSLPLQVHSEIGRGSTFSIDLPRVCVTAEEAPPLTISDTSRQRALRARRDLTILHVEDDPAIAASLRVLLEVEGYCVKQAASGEQALQLVRDDKLRPDMIITDYQLPRDITGEQVVMQIAALLGKRPPTILLTGDISKQRREALKLCVDRIIEKPADSEALLETIEMLALQAAFAATTAGAQGNSVEPIK